MKSSLSTPFVKALNHHIILIKHAMFPHLSWDCLSDHWDSDSWFTLPRGPCIVKLMLEPGVVSRVNYLSEFQTIAFLDEVLKVLSHRKEAFHTIEDFVENILFFLWNIRNHIINVEGHGFSSIPTNVLILSEVEPVGTLILYPHLLPEIDRIGITNKVSGITPLTFRSDYPPVKKDFNFESCSRNHKGVIFINENLLVELIKGDCRLHVKERVFGISNYVGEVIDVSDILEDRWECSVELVLRSKRVKGDSLEMTISQVIVW